MNVVLMADRITALGFRLAGVRIIEPRPGELSAQFRTALQDADLVLLDMDVAGALPSRELRVAMEAGDPPVQIVPSLPSVEPDTSVRLQCRLALGVGR